MWQYLCSPGSGRRLAGLRRVRRVTRRVWGVDSEAVESVLGPILIIAAVAGVLTVGLRIYLEHEEKRPIREAMAEAKREADRQARSARAEVARATQLQETRKAYRDWEYVCRAHALTCVRCGNLAYPIPLTADRYACPACAHQFAGAPHQVPVPPANPDAL